MMTRKAFLQLLGLGRVTSARGQVRCEKLGALYKLLPMTCCLVLLMSTLAGCGASPTSMVITLASPTVPSSSSSLSPGPAPSVAANPSLPLPMLSSIPTAASSEPAEGTPTLAVTPLVVANSTVAITPMPTPSAMVPPSVSATPTSTLLPPGPSITPTRLITVTLTPTVTPTPFFTPTPLPTIATTEDVFTILLIGVDASGQLRSQNTDVILVVIVNKDTKQVSLLSIPRDLWVYIPTYGWNRINTAHKRGHLSDYPGNGPGLLMDTIEANLGIPIDHWFRVDYRGFIRAVNALGGVEMTVNCPVNLQYQLPTAEGEEELFLEPGVYQMDGLTALRYVRTRRGGSDFDRARRQQQFLKAMWNQTKTPETITKIPQLWAALKDTFQTDLDVLDVVSLAPVALEISPQRIRSRYIGPRQTYNWVTSEGSKVLLPDYGKMQEVVTSLYAPPSAAEDQVASEAARIQVRNGTYRRQLAKIGADHLRWYGFNIVDTGLADNPEYKRTKVIVFNDKPQAMELLAPLLNIKPENIVYQPDPNQPADLLVILGEDYDPCQK